MTLGEGWSISVPAHSSSLVEHRIYVDFEATLYCSKCTKYAQLADNYINLIMCVTSYALCEIYPLIIQNVLEMGPFGFD